MGQGRRIPVVGVSARRRDILGLPLAVADAEASAAVIVAAIRAKRSLQVAFVNAHLAVGAMRDPSLAASLRQFHLLNDGIGIEIASYVLHGRGFPANLNGTDFVPFLLDRAPDESRLYLVGATPAVVEAAALHYAAQWPQHRVVGWRDGYFTPDDGEAVASCIREAAPDLVLVAMGSPKQETWIAAHGARLGAVSLGVGALFDFATGRVARAPPWLRAIHLEWLYRLALEPRRLWPRYGPGAVVFFVGLLKARLRSRANHGDA